MAIHRVYIREGQQIPASVLAEVEQNAHEPTVFDEDCPELTDEQYAEFASIAEQQPPSSHQRPADGREMPVSVAHRSSTI